MLIVGSRSVAPPPPPEIILEDAFTGETLDTDEWTAATLGDDSTVTQDDELILTGTVGEVGYARVISDLEIPTSGRVTIEVDWTPGKLYADATGRPYIAIVPASPTREGTYYFPYTSDESDACVTIKLGASTDTTSRTSIGCGLFNSVFGSVIGYVAYAAELACAENSTYALKLEINWDTKSLSFWLDGDPKITNTTFGYPDATFSGDHFIELAYCDYGAASNPVEKFDNLVITVE
jgi:hypothetical protein